MFKNRRYSMLAMAVALASTSLSATATESLMWRKLDSGQVSVHKYAGLSKTDEVALSVVSDQSWKVVAVGDFDGDGNSDVLWRNQGTGANHVYFTNDSGIVSRSDLNAVPDTNWEVVGSGDFDGDGKDDLLWRNAVTGINWLYFMNGASAKQRVMLNTVADTNWKVAAVADLDADGKDDIIWRNQVSGLNWAYLMDGNTIKVSQKINQVAATGWSIIAADDFTGDGKADILWRNSNSGLNYLYTMNGAAITSADYINSVPSEWHIEGVLDLDGDTKADILWRNQVSGGVYGYLMNGHMPQTIKSLDLSLPTAWQALGVMQYQSGTVQPVGVEITPAGPVKLLTGECTDVSALVVYSNASRQPSDAIEWNCSSAVSLDINAGQVCGVSAAEATCTATYQSFVDELAISVTDVPPEIDHLEISPLSPVALLVSDTQDMTLTVVYTDQSTQVDPSGISWSCASAEASIDTNGLVTAVSVGTTTCRADYDDQFISFDVQVSEQPLVPDHLEVSPQGTVSLEVGESQAMTATGFYTNGEFVTSPDSATWECAQAVAAAATISSKGVISAVAEGDIDCQVSWEGFTVQIPVSVDPVQSQGIEIFFEKPADWEGCHVYFWAADPLTAKTWPGTAMDSATLESPWCYYQFPAEVTSTNLVFNNGIGDKKSLDYLAITESGCPDGQGGWTAKADCDLPVTGPKAWATPGSSNFSTDSIDVVLHVSNGTAQYNLTGDACTSGTAYSDGEEVTLGADLAISESVQLSLCATDGATEASASFTYTKVEQSAEVFINRLGYTYEKNRTTFALWSPDNSQVAVRVNGNFYPMTKVSATLLNTEYSSKTSDVYAVTVPGDLHLASYNFVMNYQAGDEANCRYTTSRYDDPTDCYFTRDPYGVMVEPGTDNNIVVDLSLTEPDGGWAPVPALVEREDAIIYEVHVRDFTIDASSGVSANKRGTFMGMVESGTTYETVKTGIDHLKELGVTHVQLLPMYDYATCSEKDSIYQDNRYDQVWSALGIPYQPSDTCYNWGYDPENYNVPEERYSMTPTDYVNRVKEVKTMINEFHKAGIRVVMDVVYNHVWIPDSRSFMHPMERVFESYLGPITTRYSFSVDGEFYDLSGTGHTLNTDDPMVSQMVLDSLRFWADEYGMDGFRFDLVGIFRTDVVGHWAGTMMSEFAERNLLMYGEPWNGYATEPRGESNVVRMGTVGKIHQTHFGVFNGRYRDAIRGEGNEATGGMFGDGFIFNSMNDGNFSITAGMRGAIRAQANRDPNTAIDLWDQMFAIDPEQSINYVSAHDNLGLADKIHEWADASGQGSNTAYLDRLQMYANGIILTSQGIPFIHAGAEMKRDKQRQHNSYLSPDSVNAFRWNWKVENAHIFDYYKDVISMRRQHAGFRLNTWDEINNNMNTWVHQPGTVISYINGAANGDDWSEILVIYNSGGNFSYTPDGSGWKVAMEQSDASAGGGRAVNGSITVEGAAVTVLYKD